MFLRLNIPVLTRGTFWPGLAAGLGVSRAGIFARRLRQQIRHVMDCGEVVLFASCRRAVAVAVRELGVDAPRVAVPGYVCPAVLTALRSAGATAVPVDCAARSLRFDPAGLEKLVDSGSVDAILAPNTYGLDQDFPFLLRLGVPVIEDAAYQAGINVGDCWCGLRGDYGIWSFNFKALTGVGGGILFHPAGKRVKLPTIAEDGWARRTTELGRLMELYVRGFGRHHIPRFLPGGRPPSGRPELQVRSHLLEMGPEAMSELQAAVILSQWVSRERIQQQQRENVGAIEAALIELDVFRGLRDRRDPIVPHLYPIVVEGGDPAKRVYQSRTALHAHRIQTETPYPILLGDRKALPNCHDVADRLLLVPCHASLGSKQIERVCEGLRAASNQSGLVRFQERGTGS